mmetsp:Transcript_22180/g.55921  ORF Transcript_22180/g.55921 Transcript_22180/m.55921 type:complete len:458 (-) Transcript_22180:324-1697(-)|eukprot:CAMPEP_0179000500 /NCGR_PEP_ID=MMETSP0795-20121207/10721_1 /TAXON_ID=88552 /ORGANISM="Amoebophrya sp., Strain Ameob2" /LENGTH=457 /DNA_ID=CAMNT_0020693533 /DNA_START=134 /DNA_END=1507 /DNA_ORIENTATION=-
MSAHGLPVAALKTSVIPPEPLPHAGSAFDALHTSPASRQDWIGRVYFEHGCDNSVGCFSTDFLNCLVQVALVYFALSRRPRTFSSALYEASWYLIAGATFFGGLLHAVCSGDDPSEQKLDYVLWLCSGVLLLFGSAFLALIAARLLHPPPLAVALYSRSGAADGNTTTSASPDTKKERELALNSSSSDKSGDEGKNEKANGGRVKKTKKPRKGVPFPELPEREPLVKSTSSLKPTVLLFLTEVSQRRGDFVILVTAVVLSGVHAVLTLPFTVLGGFYLLAWLALCFAVLLTAFFQRASCCGSGRVVATPPMPGALSFSRKDESKYSGESSPGDEGMTASPRTGESATSARKPATAGLRSLPRSRASVSDKTGGGRPPISMRAASVIFLSGATIAIAAFALQVTLAPVCAEAWVTEPAKCPLNAVMPHVNHNTLSHIIFGMSTPFLIVGGALVFRGMV